MVKESEKFAYLRENIPQSKWAQDETRNFRWSSN
jgi:hypothetical protein